MTRRLCVLLVCALIPMGVVTGCGGGGSTTHANSTPGKTVTVSLAERVRKAIATCQKGIAASPYLTAAEKVSGKADCTAVKTGNPASVSGLREVLKKACERAVIAHFPKPNEPAALAACRKVYQARATG